MAKKTMPDTASTASRIFKVAWKFPGISRIAIAERLGLDKSTVTNQVNHLISIGLLEEVDEGCSSSRGGRRPIQLAIRRSFGRVLGMELQYNGWKLVELDLSGSILSEHKVKGRFNPDTLADSIASIVESFETPQNSQFGPVLGIGIGLGGLIDQKKNRVRYSIPLGIKEPIDFGKSFSSRISIPCIIENDANCCAWGEIAFGKGDARNFLYVLVEYRDDTGTMASFGGIGVGIGIVLGGRVYTGSHGNAGEFRSAFCDGPGDSQLSLPEEELKIITKDPKILAKANDELARNLAMLANTLNLDMIIISGDIEEMGVDLPSTISRRLEENWMFPVLKRTEIRYSTLGPRAVAYGAAGMMLETMVSNNLIPGLDGSKNRA